RREILDGHTDAEERLQWGRRVFATETHRPCPRTVERGCRFNGAVACSRRRPCPPPAPTCPCARLQWGRRVFATETRRLELGSPSARSLQWGRRVFATETC